MQPEETAAKITHSTCPHTFTEHQRVVIFYPLPPCAPASTTGTGAHSSSWQCPSPSFRTQLKQVSSEAFSEKCTLPYFSEKVNSCRLCLPTSLNPHLDRSGHLPSQKMTIPCLSPLLDHEVLEDRDQVFFTCVSPMPNMGQQTQCLLLYIRFLD